MGLSDWGVVLINPHLEPKLKKNYSYTFMACSGVFYSFTIKCQTL
jgi:hypothetical protein